MDVHQELRFWWQDLCQVGIGLYDAQSDWLTTFVASDAPNQPLPQHRAKLSETPTLDQLARQRSNCLIRDLRSELTPASPHHQRRLEAGFRSSYTVPMFTPEGELNGFLFFDAEQPDYFSEDLLGHLNVYAGLLSAIIQTEMASAQMLSAAVFTAKRFNHWRDQDNSAHLARVAHFARLVAENVVERNEVSEHFIELLFQFAPLHDIGKAALPDDIRNQTGELNYEQRTLMHTHTVLGMNIVDELLGRFGLNKLAAADMLRYVVLYHHERWDGGGYPSGLRGNAIPLAARIVGLADCFDSLLSPFPYKQAWTYNQTKQYILEQRGHQFDPQCVDALFADESHIHAIRDRYRNN